MTVKGFLQHGNMIFTPRKGLVTYLWYKHDIIYFIISCIQDLKFVSRLWCYSCNRGLELMVQTAHMGAFLQQLQNEQRDKVIARESSLHMYSNDVAMWVLHMYSNCWSPYIVQMFNINKSAQCIGLQQFASIINCLWCWMYSIFLIASLEKLVSLFPITSVFLAYDTLYWDSWDGKCTSLPPVNN